MLLFEEHRSNKKDYFYYQSNENLSFPLHTHNSFELIHLMEGRLQVIIDNNSFILSKNQYILILPNQAHSFINIDYCKTSLCVFSNDTLPDFYNLTLNLEAINPIFYIDELENIPLLLIKSKDKFYRKSILYLVASKFNNNTTYTNRNTKFSTFVQEVLNFIENNYKKNITLSDLAKEIGYDYNYTSNLFNSTFKTNFLKLVNTFRLDSAIQMLTDTDTKIIDIALDCGFGSTRTFNRSFFELKKMSPNDYRKMNKNN